MKIKVNKQKIIKEIAADTPFYTYTAGKSGASERKVLDKLFGSKERIVEKFSAVVPLDFTKGEFWSDEEEKAPFQFAEFCLGIRHEYFEAIVSAGIPAINPAQQERKEKIKNDPLINYFVKNLKTDRNTFDKMAKLTRVAIQNTIAQLKTDFTNEYLSTLNMILNMPGLRINIKDYKIYNSENKSYSINNFFTDIKSLRRTLLEIINDNPNAKYNINSLQEYPYKFMTDSNNQAKLQSNNAYRRVLAICGNQTRNEDLFYETLFSLIVGLRYGKNSVFWNQYIYSALDLEDIFISFIADLKAFLMDNLSSLHITETLHDRLFAEVSKKNWSDCVSIITRNPLEIARMSDFSQLGSCHSVGGSFSSCAVQEAVSEKAGAVAYFFTVPTAKIEPEMLNKLENSTEEFMADKQREVPGFKVKDGNSTFVFNPLCRVRLRTYEFYYEKDGVVEQVYLIVPSGGKVYGATVPKYGEYLMKLCIDKQRDILDDIEEQAIKNKKLFSHIDLMGGSYTDTNDTKGVLLDFFYQANLTNALNAIENDYDITTSKEFSNKKQPKADERVKKFLEDSVEHAEQSFQEDFGGEPIESLKYVVKKYKIIGMDPVHPTKSGIPYGEIRVKTSCYMQADFMELIQKTLNCSESDAKKIYDNYKSNDLVDGIIRIYFDTTLVVSDTSQNNTQMYAASRIPWFDFKDDLVYMKRKLNISESAEKTMQKYMRVFKCL